MKVKKGQTYRYDPCGWDVVSPCKGNTLKKGDIVKVITLPSAPPPNTMGNCYVGDPKTGEFICMVKTNSLFKKDGRTAAEALAEEEA